MSHSKFIEEANHYLVSRTQQAVKDSPKGGQRTALLNVAAVGFKTWLQGLPENERIDILQILRTYRTEKQVPDQITTEEEKEAFLRLLGFVLNPTRLL